MLFDHVGVHVSDFAASKRFYEAALAPLGATILRDFGDAAMVGRLGEGGFWFYAKGPATSPIHVAFAAKTRAEVDAFYKAAMAAGGRDNGPPGLRPQYNPHYYGAFVLDPDGHNVEAVCKTPE